MTNHWKESRSYKTLNEIPELLSFKQIKPKNTTTTEHKVTHVHGSVRANDIIKAAEKKSDEKKLKEEKKQTLLAKREEIKEKFYKCKQKCVCVKDGKCNAFDFKECSVCHNILKSHCDKQACRNAAGEKPKMLLVDAALKHPKQVVRYDDTTDDEMSCVEESDDDVEK